MTIIYKTYHPNPMPNENYVHDEGYPTFLDGCESQFNILDKEGKSLALCLIDKQQ